MTCPSPCSVSLHRLHMRYSLELLRAIISVTRLFIYAACSHGSVSLTPYMPWPAELLGVTATYATPLALTCATAYITWGSCRSLHNAQHQPTKYTQGNYSVIMALTTVFVGHSFGKRLQQFIKSRAATRNFGLNESEMRFRWRCQPGARMEHLKAWTPWILQQRPDIVYAEIGLNDLTDRSAQWLSDALTAWTRTLVQAGVRLVIVGEVMRRGDVANFTRAEEFFNREVAKLRLIMLYATATEDGPVYWSHYKLRRRLRLTDRVHLTDPCQYLLYRSIRGALLSARARLR